MDVETGLKVIIAGIGTDHGGPRKFFIKEKAVGHKADDAVGGKIFRNASFVKHGVDARDIHFKRDGGFEFASLELKFFNGVIINKGIGNGALVVGTIG